MTIVDANYVLRLLLNDIPAQAETAVALLYNSKPGDLYIDRVTLAKITYVLRAKQYNHRQITQFLDELYTYPAVSGMGTLERTALGIYRDTALGFEDCLLAAWQKTSQGSVATFDKPLQRYLAKA